MITAEGAGSGAGTGLVERVELLWAALGAAGRTAPPGWCGIVVVGDRTVTTAPDPESLAALDAAVGALPLTLRTDPAALSRLLDVVDVLGPARLSYLSSPDALPPPGPAEPGARGDVAGLLALVDTADAGESGLAGAHHGASVVRRDGVVAAAAGYEPWPGDVAHLAVLTQPPSASP